MSEPEMINVFEVLPDELILEMFQFFTQKEIFQTFKLISPSMNELCTRQITWRQVLYIFEEPDLMKLFRLYNEDWESVYHSIRLQPSSIRSKSSLGVSMNSALFGSISEKSQQMMRVLGAGGRPYFIPRVPIFGYEATMNWEAVPLKFPKVKGKKLYRFVIHVLFPHNDNLPRVIFGVVDGKAYEMQNPIPPNAENTKLLGKCENSYGLYLPSCQAMHKGSSEQIMGVNRRSRNVFVEMILDFCNMKLVFRVDNSKVWKCGIRTKNLKPVIMMKYKEDKVRLIGLF